MNKLLKISEGKDAQGCYIEPSARVRAAAANALNRCRAVTAPTTPAAETPPPEGTETPRLAPPPEQPAVPPAETPSIPAPATTPPPTTSVELPLLNSAASATQIRIVSPATYTEPMTKPAALPRQWPAAATMLDARWQRPIAAHRSE
jgi:hypothetical protein